MILKPASREDVLTVFKRPEIYDAVSSDYAPPIDEWEVQDGAEYIGGYIDDNVLGIWVLHRKSKHVGQCHFQVLPEYRKHYAKLFGGECLRYTFDNTPYIKLVAEIPECYPNVIYFALQMGFKIDGRIDGIYRKNDRDFDTYILSAEDLS